MKEEARAGARGSLRANQLRAYRQTSKPANKPPPFLHSLPSIYPLSCPFPQGHPFPLMRMARDQGSRGCDIVFAAHVAANAGSPCRVLRLDRYAFALVAAMRTCPPCAPVPRGRARPCLFPSSKIWAPLLRANSGVKRTVPVGASGVRFSTCATPACGVQPMYPSCAAQRSRLHPTTRSNESTEMPARRMSHLAREMARGIACELSACVPTYLSWLCAPTVWCKQCGPFVCLLCAVAHSCERWAHRDSRRA